MNGSRSDIVAGLGLGLLYMVEAVLSTGIFFLVWPILGGVFAAGLARSRSASFGAGAGARSGARAGLVGGLVLLVAGTPITYALLRHLGEEPGFFGSTLDLGPIPALLVMFAGYGLFGLLVAAGTGALVGLFAGSARPG
ncbi:MAG TPA: hypothetical protein VEZ20_02480 [Allosphingosinicella sp.]|jgi:hypothetical protein|nr:hypothetical protein [Allosphingosinicella sp.]